MTQGLARGAAVKQPFLLRQLGLQPDVGRAGGGPKLMSKDGAQRVPTRSLASSLKLKEREQNDSGEGWALRGKAHAQPQQVLGGRHRHRGLPFKSRHRPRSAAAAGTSPLTAVTPRSADPTAAAAANCSSCCLRRRPRAAASSPGLGPRPAMVSWIISRLVV